MGAMKERTMQEKLKSKVSIRWGLAIFGAAILFLIPAGRAAAQSGTAGPLPAATPAGQTTPAPQPVAQTAGAKPNLAGTWVLNKAQSDDPRQKMHDAMGGGEGGQGGQGGGYGGHGGWGGGGNGGGGGGGGYGGGGGGGYGGGNGGGGGRGQGRGEGMINELSQLTIEQTSTSAKVTGSSGRVLALYSANNTANSTSTQGSSGSSSGSSSASTDGGDEYAPPAAQWQGSQLVAVGERRGGTNTQTYELSPDGKQLFVTTKMESHRFTQPVIFRLVYDPAKTSAGGGSQ